MLRRILLPILLGLILGACSNFSKVMKSTDPKEKYEAAVAYYEEKDYYRAGLLFEDVMPAFVGAAESEQLQFYYAYCHFYQSQYLLANHYFKSFFNTYNRSPYAEEALYMSAYSLYKDTPRYNLDQSNTNDAIGEMQDFLNRYPASEYAPEANRIILELRQKLEKKAFENAMQYAQLRRYKAASVALDNFMKDYPDSELKEQAMFKKLEAEFELAKISIPSKQQERFETALITYKKFSSKYPDSEYFKTASKISDAATKELDRITASVR
ncbi:outer membrane protein assembly factor BamD [Limibacter armeniacum]|uniref:outer membrane protein assembly factor BamD n=1 Tax=Limibacter armeniacum TaxID=466084 RepID=UPI002FE69F34